MRGFAAMPEGSQLAVIRGARKLRLSVFGSVSSEAETSPGLDLEYTCGTLAQIPRARRSLNVGSERDVLSGQPIQLGNYVRLACSADRKIVAGWLSATDDWLYIGVPPKRLAPRTKLFAVSPDGAWVAFANRESQTCIEHGGVRRCFGGDAIDRYSVDSSGAILFTEYTEESCYYTMDGQPSRTPDSKHTEADACTAIALLSPDATKPVRLLELAQQPQWVDESAVPLLMRLAKPLRISKVVRLNE
jgi:hypothetical protein